jgi:hypothetical protein
MRTWKKSQAALALLLPAVVLQVGCSSMSNTDKGVLGGAGLGALAGGLIGHATGHTGAGAAIGAVAGGLGGGLIGAEADAKQHEQAVRQAQAARGPLGLEEVANLARSGAGDAVIIEQIRLSGRAYLLTAEQIAWLKQAGVSDVVILEMQQAGRGRVVYAPPPVVVVEQPPPPPHIGIGIGYSSGRRW